MKNVLIVGGAGYVGREIIDNFLKKDFKITVFDNLIYNQKIKVRNKKFTFIKGDLRKEKDLIKLVNQKYDTTIILAGLVGDPITKKYKSLSKQINDIGMFKLIDILRNYNFSKQTIFISTCSNYGLSKKKKVNEQSKLKPLSLYAKSKVNIEKILLSKKYKKINPTILRFATAFGQSKRMRYDLTVNQFILEMIKDKVIKVYDVDTWRPYCHLKDFSRAIEKIIYAPSKLTSSQVFNVGDDINNYTKGKMAKIVQKYLKGKIEYLSISKDRRDYRVSFAKIKKVLKFKCKYSLEFGIKEMIKNVKGLNKKKLNMLAKLGNYTVKF